MRIVVDVMGGDHGCEVVVLGAQLALESIGAITELFLVGNESEIQSALKKAGFSDPRLRVVHASQFLTMEDKPVEGLRRKKDCSILRAMDLLKEGRGDALISTGNTGGLVAASTIRLRALPGVERPVLAAVMPSRESEFILIDAGANPECKPVYLAQFAIMGAIYSKAILGKANPRVGILSNGSEENKGNDLTRETLKICRQLDLNFIGYVEGYDLFSDAVEVVVTDGFTGNIVLKTCESMGRAVGHLLKREVTRNPWRKFGALLARGAFQSIKERMNPDAYGGAPLLGLNGNVIKTHGSAREFAIKNAIRVATETIEHQINRQIVDQIAKAGLRLTGEEAA